MLAAALTLLGALVIALAAAIGSYRDAQEVERWRGDRPKHGAHRPSYLGDRARRVVLTNAGAVCRIERGRAGRDSGFFAGDLGGGSPCAL